MTPLSSVPVSRRVGSTGMAVFPLAIDGSVFGWAADAVATAEVLDRFTAIGGNLISTADHYAGGRSEVMIGSWLRRHGQRDHLVLATKIGRHPDAPGLSASAVERAVTAALGRLGTDYVDLLSFDGEDPDTPLEESLTAAADLVRRGLVGHLSAAGWSASALRRAAHIALDLGLPGFTTVIAEYNLLEREPYESDIAPVALAQDLGVLAKLPLASGYLRGDFRSKRDRPASPMFAGALRYVGRRGNRALAVLDEIAAEAGTHPGCVALAWLLAKPLVTAPILRCADAGQFVDLVPALDLTLTCEQIARLDRIR